ncbi:fungal-specific transcription factor domain-containing protein [Lentinula edodes]|uniref:fungal-specific transcription factor domain-containing protein n=1 Tax=Lentinula edodes TaxID=5353 RepID=UPI001E8CD060|nr:fungal-specific transcription factor domain-containing protein [Lentinula edodes]KAH7875845.1 fungal-specific transcription factor domain-containing protein [Lentinula edodes]
MSEGEEQVLYKKRRLQNSCDHCKIRKQRCDSASRPGNICSSCIAFQVECTHLAASARKKRGPPKGTPRGQRSAKSVVSSILSGTYQPPTEPAAINKLLFHLAEHIQTLDEEISALRLRLSQLTTSTSSTLSVFSPTQDSTSRFSPEETLLAVNRLQLVSNPPPGSYLDSDVHAIEGLSEHLQRLTFANAKDRHFGGSSSLMLVKTAIDIKNEYSNSSISSSNEDSSKEQNDYEGVDSDYKRPEFWIIHPWQNLPEDDTPPFVFPDADLINSLASLYFTHVNAYFPILHEPLFLRSISLDLHREDRNFGALVLAVCSLGARFSHDERIYEDGVNQSHEMGSTHGASEQSIGWKWIRQIQPVRRTFTAPPSLYEIQLYQIYVFFMQSSSTPEICWILVSIGVRFAQDVGAHRKKQHDAKPTVESELWKRAFWMLYVMDIFTSAFLGRPRSIGIEDFDIDLPIDCDDEYWENPDNPDQAFQQPPGKPSRVSYVVRLIKLMDILGLAMRTIYSIRRSDMWTTMGLTALQWNEKTVAELDSSLNKWIDELPQHLRWDPSREDSEHFRQSVMLYTTYYWVQIQIHRPFIARPGEDSVLSFPSLAICANAARSCCHVMEVQRRRNAGLLAMPNLLMALFNASIVLLVNVWRGRRLRGTGRDVRKELVDVYRCIDLLSLHENRWQQAGRFHDILREIIAISHFHDDQCPPDTGPCSMKRSLEAASDDTTEDSSSVRARGSNTPEEYCDRQISSDHNSMDTATLPRWMQSPPFQSSGTHNDTDFESMSLLPTHSSELGSLPIYESFTDWSMDEQWSFDAGTSSSNSQQTRSNADPHIHASMTMQTQSATSLLHNRSSTYSPTLVFDSLNTTSLEIESRATFTAPLFSPAGGSAISQDVTGTVSDNADVLRNQDTNPNDPGWDDWGAYMANVDEVLQSMNPRL